jgi:hypothetical protein
VIRTLEEALVELGAKKQEVPVGSLWRHKKTGTIYTIKDIAILEYDLSLVVSYKELGASKVHWIRPLSEFLDGRFEKVVR